MKFLIITHVKHLEHGHRYFAYAPYVREMNIWLKHVDEIEIVAPLSNYERTDIDLGYEHSKISFSKIPEIEFTSVLKIIKSIFKTPIIFYSIFGACKRADHIHLRCPGNIGLLGCIAQIFFPKKIKTAKYAGNWDPESKQPLSYRIQKGILRSPFLTKNMQVLVYGNWTGQTKNIKSFFTATYRKDEVESIKEKDYKGSLKFLFVGSLVDGKQPLFVIKVIEGLINKGVKANLDLFGDGILKNYLQNYIVSNELDRFIAIHGNVSKTVLMQAYQSAHFLLLPSKSEGWPKAIAEAMFFGVIPVSTNVSCVNWMIDEGRRGVLINDNLEKAIKRISESIKNDNLVSMSVAAQQWSQKYTLDVFEEEIKKLLQVK